MPPKYSRKGTYLPEDWALTADDVRFAAEAGLDHPAIYAEAAKFKDYWLSKAGPDARKRDWSRTWSNWIRRADKETKDSGYSGRVAAI